MSGGPGARVSHVGLCVTDLERSVRFYEQALGFTHSWRFEVPDEATAPVLRLTPPVGLTAAYLTHGGFTLELLHYAGGSTAPARERVMNEVGLTHLSVSVEDIPGTLERVRAAGGEVLEDTCTPVVAFVRDPDGQLIELNLPTWQQDAGGPAQG